MLLATAIMIAIGGFLFVVLSSFILFLVILSRKKSVVAHFFYDDNNEKIKRYKKIQDKIEYDGGTYLYNHKFVIKRGFTLHIYYYKGNPNPIDFTSSKQTPKISSESFDSVLKNNIIAQMFGQKDVLAEISKILTIINLIVGLIGLILLFKIALSKGGVSIVSETNREWLVEVVRSAIRG